MPSAVPVAPASLAWINRGAAVVGAAYLALLTRFYLVDRDFSVYYHAAQAAKAGGSPYHLEGYVFLYGPLFLLMTGPLATLKLPAARLVWFIVQCVAVTGFVGLCIRESRSSLARRWWGVVFLCAVMARPTHDDLALGQIGTFIALVAVASFALSDRHPSIAGLLLALATSIKFSPSFLNLQYVREKRWSVVCWFVGGGGLLLGVTLLALGTDVHVDAVRTLAGGASYPLLAEHNDSVFALWLRMFTDNPWVNPLVNAPALGVGLIIASVVFVLGACISSTRPHDDPARRVQVFNLWLVGMVLLYPASGLYTLVVLLLPALTIIQHLKDHPHTGLRMLFIVAVTLLYLPPMNGLVDVARLESPWMSVCYAPQAFSSILLFILSFSAIRRATVDGVPSGSRAPDSTNLLTSTAPRLDVG
jgi:hypothetical protein